MEGLGRDKRVTKISPRILGPQEYAPCRKPHSVGQQGTLERECRGPSNSPQREQLASPQPPASTAEPVAGLSQLPARDAQQGFGGGGQSPAADLQNGTASSADRAGPSASPSSPCCKGTTGDEIRKEQPGPSSCEPGELGAKKTSALDRERQGIGGVVPQLTAETEKGGDEWEGAGGQGTANLLGSRAAPGTLLSAGKCSAGLNPSLPSVGRRSVMDVLVDAQLLAAAALPQKVWHP